MESWINNKKFNIGIDIYSIWVYTYIIEGTEGSKMKIEEHLFENKNHTVRIEYHVYKTPFVYEIKAKSQLTKAEKEANKKQIFHF